MARSKNLLATMLFNKKSALILGSICILGIGLVASRAVFGKSDDKQVGSALGVQNSTRQNKSQPTRKIEINKSINIPIGDDEEEFITYTIVDAELKDNIIIRGERASAVEGKEFLVFNVKLSNDLEKKVKLNTRDNVRLAVNQTDDRLAPNIHNDPVEVQPISDQYTRLGFSVFKTDSNYMLYLGQISEDKIEIPLNL